MKKTLHVKAEVVQKKQEEEGVIEAIVGSSSIVDRHREVVSQDGWVLDNYKKNPVVLWGHNIREERPPIGKALKVWLDGEKKKKKLMFKVKMDMADEFAASIYRKIKDGFINTVSVGFIPLEIDPEAKDWTWSKAELLELSFVPIPANPQALVEIRSLGIEPIEEEKLASYYRSFDRIDEVRDEIEDEEVEEVMSDQVVKYTKATTAPEGEDFDLPGEVAKSNIEQLKTMAAYVAEGDAKEKNNYKLIHHMNDGRVSWRGLSLAMAILAGARDGIEMSEADRKGVYNHLVEHYKEFNKVAPTWELVKAQSLKTLNNEINSLALDREDKHVVKLIKVVRREVNENSKQQKELLGALKLLDKVADQILKGGEQK